MEKLQYIFLIQKILNITRTDASVRCLKVTKAAKRGVVKYNLMQMLFQSLTTRDGNLRLNSYM